MRELALAHIAIITAEPFFTTEELALVEARGHRCMVKADLSKAMELIFADPPEVLIVQKDLDNYLDRIVIQAMKTSLQLALMPIILSVPPACNLTTLDWKVYSVDDVVFFNANVLEKIARVELALERMERVGDNNPLTKLPGNSSILKYIQGVLDRNEPNAVAYVDIDSFKPYNDRYGFSRGDEVIRMVARILVNTVQEIAGHRGFVGHVGGDDFVFVTPTECVERVCQKVLLNFDALIRLFLDEEDIEHGCFLSEDRQGNKQTFPLTSLSIAVVPCVANRYRHYGEVAATAAQLKKKVKSMPGSNYLIDRRSCEKKS